MDCTYVPTPTPAPTCLSSLTAIGTVICLHRPSIRTAHYCSLLMHKCTLPFNPQLVKQTYIANGKCCYADPILFINQNFYDTKRQLTRINEQVFIIILRVLNSSTNYKCKWTESTGESRRKYCWTSDFHPLNKFKILVKALLK